ncbi:hypothetical protein SCE1572_05535 [Sorangium cellulosum So0157-2]|uniref:Uncharacterized protein n=1 Tax=Sorangium cellulosum So0157-2 TaxID=1254432 RepID=S4XQB7_SORCE|nr:hypothetical protein SCE1572_05535 [Sorangium cellulosum So0157-2]
MLHGTLDPLGIQRCVTLRCRLEHTLGVLHQQDDGESIRRTAPSPDFLLHARMARRSRQLEMMSDGVVVDHRDHIASIDGDEVKLLAARTEDILYALEWTRIGQHLLDSISIAVQRIVNACLHERMQAEAVAVRALLLIEDRD